MKMRTWGLLLFALLLALAITPLPDNVQAQGETWQITYYNSNNLSGNGIGPYTYPQPLNLNFNGVPLQADGVTPVPGIGADNWSAIAQISAFFQAGTYQFTGTVDDRAVITIGGVEVFRDDQPGPTPINFQRTLPAGLQTINIQFIEFASQARLSLSWQLGAGGPQFTPTPSGPLAQVVNVRGLALRTGPFLGGSLIAVLRPNIQYAVNGKSNDEGGPFTWYRINTGDREGWASGRYLTVNLPDQIPTRTTVFDTIDNAENTGVIGTTRAVMNFRRRPSIRAQRIGQIPWGAEVQLLHRTVQGGENFWFHVRYEDQVGWIFAPYVSVRGFIEAVPIL